MRSFAIAVVLSVSGLGATVLGDAPCCSQCGCGQCVKKVCRLVCEPKKETKWVYDCVCEDFCLPGKSTKCGERTVPDCTVPGGCRKEIIWQPSCGPIRTKKKLVKRPVTIEKPSYKCVVVCLCPGCGCRRVDEKATAEYEATGVLPAGAEVEEVEVLPELLQPANESVQRTAEEPDAQVTAASGTGTFFGRLLRR